LPQGLCISLSKRLEDYTDRREKIMEGRELYF